MGLNDYQRLDQEHRQLKDRYAILTRELQATVQDRDELFAQLNQARAALVEAVRMALNAEASEPFEQSFR